MAQELDLSAGLKPKSVSAPPSLDLSAGFVTKPAAPVQDFTSNPKGEGLYRMLPASNEGQATSLSTGEIQVPYSKVKDAQAAGYNLHPDEEARFQKDTEYEGQGPTLIERAKTAVSKVLEPSEGKVGQIPVLPGIDVNAAKAAGRVVTGIPAYVKELASAYTRSLETGNANEVIDLLDPTKLPEGMQKQFKEDFKKDPQLAADNLVGTIAGLAGVAAMTHGGEEGVRTVAEKTKAKVADGVREKLQTVLGAGKRQVKAEVTEQAERANKAAETTEEKNKGIEAANKEARLKVKSAAVEAQKATNAPEPYLKGENVETSLRQTHNEAVKRQKDVEAKRTKLASDDAESRQNVTARVQALYQAAKDYFKKGFADVAARLDAPDEETGQVHTVPYADLDADIEESEGNIKGSRENVKIFQDIGKKAQGTGGSELSTEEMMNLSPDERKAAMELPGAKYSDLDGYYQEAGRIIGNPSTAPDVRQAVVKFRELLGKRMQALAEEVDPAAAAKHKLLRSQYKEYAQGFRDYTGPSGSASPVAKGLKAVDAHNATEPYFGLAPQESARVKRIIVGDTNDPTTQFTDKEIVGPDGKPEPAWRFRKQTHAAINDLRNIQKGLKALPKPEVLAKDVETSADALAQARAKVRETASAKTEQKPTEPVDVPELDPQKIRDEFITKKLRDWTNVGRFQLARLVAGPIGMVIGAATGHPFVELGSALYTGAEMTPFALQQMLDRPKVREWFTRPPEGEVEALRRVPYADRVRIADTFRGMVKEADKQGKPLKLSPAVVAFMAQTGSQKKQAVTQ